MGSPQGADVTHESQEQGGGAGHRARDSGICCGARDEASAKVPSDAWSQPPAAAHGDARKKEEEKPQSQPVTGVCDARQSQEEFSCG